MFCFKGVIHLPHDLMSFQSHASSEIQLQVGNLVQNKLEEPVRLLAVSTLNQRSTLHFLRP